MVNKRPMGHIAYLRNQYQSIDTFAQSYDYSITFMRVELIPYARACTSDEGKPAKTVFYQSNPSNTHKAGANQTRKMMDCLS